MSNEPGRPDDPYSRAEYRRLIAWERRIEREGPFLLGLLDEAPESAVLDLGCGTGEHTAFFARQGCRAVGLDRSEAMIEAARDHAARGHGRFEQADVLEAAAALQGSPPFGLAICLGNMLPSLQTDEEIERFVAELQHLLVPGGVFLLQILNYVRIVEGGVRALPVNVRPGDGDEEIVFLRLMKPQPDGRILFFPTTLTLDPESETPLAVKMTRRVPLRAWTAADLAPFFERAGFQTRLYGDMQGGPYEPLESSDLVLVALRGD